METISNDSDDDEALERLVQFDESLRQGRTPLPSDAELDGTRQFLLRLQSIWPRSDKKKIGSYHIVSNLGQGTLGATYLVEDPRTRHAHVLKVLWPNLNADHAARALLLLEAKAVESLRHAHIASFREIRDLGTVCYVVSEYCEGDSLAQWRRRKPQPLAWENASTLVARLADILDVAHRQGIAHGNLKPSNIFLSHGEEITSRNVHQTTLRIADFALAKAVQQSKLAMQGGLPWPMPQYLAPEQLRHRTRPVGPASDIYALSVLLYELLTGRCPVRGSTREEVAAHTREAPPPPRQYRPELPHALETLVLQGLQRNPRSRPASAKCLAEALRALLPVAETPRAPWWKNWLGWK